MLRITHTRRKGTTEIKLEGKLVGPWVAECRTLCARESARGQSLSFDLGELRFADQKGVELLRQLAEAGHVARSSGFASELMRRAKGESVDSRHGGHGPAAAATLVARLRAREASAFEELVRRHAAGMLPIVRRFLPDEREARGVLTQSFQVALRDARECATDADLEGWLRRIVLDACVARMTSVQDPTAAIAELLPRFDPSGAHARPVSPWAERGKAGTGLYAEVRRRIGELPPAYRVVVLLADDQRLDRHEIAARLAIPLAEVEARLHRARQALVTLLGPTLASRAAG